MNFIDKILFYISVPKCIFCNERLEIGERALCAKCAKIYLDHKERACSVCSKPYYKCDCSSAYLDSHFIHKHIKVFRYMPGDETPANQLIYKLKRENRRDVVGYIADELTESIRESLKVDENTIFTCVPRRRRARIKYGIDHAQNLGRAVAKNFGADFQMLLRSKSKNAQKKSKSREERLKNAQFVLLNEDLDLSGKTVVIIDDIVTTGASLGAAALNVKSLAPKKIIGASIAIAYKDAYTPLSASDRFKNK